LQWVEKTQLGEPLRSSIIICTRSRPRALYKLIESLQNQDAISTISKILVIDSSIDNETESLFSKKVFESQLPISYHRVSHDYTLPRKRNLGLSLLNFSEKEILHFFDDDVELSGDYVSSIRAVFEDSNIIGVGGADQNLKKKHVYKFLELVGVASNQEGVILKSGVNTQNISGAVQRETEWLSGCAMSYATSSLKGQLFDERRHFDGEDSDFSYRMSKKGKLVWNPSSRFSHKSSMAKKVTKNHKVRYHFKHLVLSCAEFDGKVQPHYCFIYLFFNGLISIAMSLKRFRILDTRIGISYLFFSFIFPLALAQYFFAKKIQSLSKKSNSDAIDTK